MKNDPSSLVGDAWRVIVLCLVTLVGFATLVYAASVGPLGGQVKIGWDASPTPGVARYNVYALTNTLAAGTNLSSALMRLQTTNLSMTVQFTNAQPRWHIVTTAVTTNGIESAPSNELIVQVPAPPTNLRTVAVEYLPTIGGTNWTEAGFFRVRVGP